jgi:hypothetical protein
MYLRNEATCFGYMLEPLASLGRSVVPQWCMTINAYLPMQVIIKCAGSVMKGAGCIEHVKFI